MKNNPKKIEAILLLPGPKRYSHFIKVVADQRETWGLFSNGWALAAVDNGDEAFPLWPAKEYAMRCAVGEWTRYMPRSIDLDTLLDILLPELKQSKTAATIFPTDLQKGTVPSLELLDYDLRRELNRIE